MLQNPRATVLAPACRNWLRRRRKSQRLNHQFVFGFKVLDTVSNDYQMIERHHWMMPFHCQTQPGLMANIATFVFFWHRRMNLIWWVRLSQTMRHTCGILFNYLLIFFFCNRRGNERRGWVILGHFRCYEENVSEKMPSLPMTPATPAYLLRSADDRLRFPRCRAVAANGKGQEGAGGGGGGGRDAGDGNVVCPLHKASATSRDSVRFFNHLLFFFLSLYHERGSDIIISIRNPTCLDVKLIQLFGLLLPVVD